MAETRNLGLDVVGTNGRAERARVYLSLACSYLKGGGAPTLSVDCASYPEFEREIERLKSECDELAAAARRAFGDVAPPEADAAAAGAEAAAPERSAPPATAKTPLRLGAELRVADEMTRNVETMRRNDKLSVANELMQVGGFRHVVVLEDDSDDIAGVLSHRDIFYGALAWSIGHGETAHQQALHDIPVKNVMCHAVTTVSPETPLADAARMMLEAKIGCLPVVANGRLVGILTEGDFLAMLTHAEVTG